MSQKQCENAAHALAHALEEEGKIESQHYKIIVQAYTLGYESAYRECPHPECPEAEEK